MITTNIKEFANSFKTSGAILGIDYGGTKIGIAVSDSNRIVATAREIYQRRDMRKDIGYLGKFATNNKICAIVLGLPLDGDGQEGENCKKIRSFAAKLHKKTNLPIMLQDERMSTAEATNILAESGMTRKKRNAIDDKVAAGIILQAVLEGIKKV